jgi:PAS domain S-box-containing protein
MIENFLPKAGAARPIRVSVNSELQVEQRLRIQYAAASALAEFDSLEESARLILESVCDHGSWEVGGLWLVDREREVMRCVEVFHRDGRFATFANATRTFRFAKGEGLPGRVWLSQRVEWLQDLQADMNFARAPMAAATGLSSGFAFPILFGKEVLGAFEFFSREPRVEDAEFAQTLRAIGLQVGQVLKRKEGLRTAAQLAAIVESSQDAIIGKDLHGVITCWNKGAEEMFGYAASEAIGQPITMLIPRDRLQEEDRIQTTFHRGKSIQHFETIRKRKDGTLVDVSISVSPIRNADGEISGASKIARDISSRKRSEAQLRHQRDVLKSIVAGAPLESILEALTLGIEQVAERPINATVLLVSPDGKHLQPVAGQRVPQEWTNLIANLEIGPETGACGAAAYSGERVIVVDTQSDSRWTGYKEQAARFNLHACWSSPILSSKGKVLGTFAVYRSTAGEPTPTEIQHVEVFTETAAIAIEHHRAEVARREMENKLEQRVAERTASLQHANHELEAFAYSVSHDLRAPLRAMSAYAETLIEEHASELSPTGIDYLKRIHRSATRLDALTQDVLALTGISRGQVRLVLVALDPLINDIIASRPEFQGRVHLRTPLGVVCGHEGLLGQVFANLLANAVKFVRAGEEPKIDVWSEPQGDSLRVFVRDNGIGIQPRDQKKIFEIFQRIHPETSFEGTGIGLSIVKTAVEKMSGTAGVTSDGLKGSTFWVDLINASP